MRQLARTGVGPVLLLHRNVAAMMSIYVATRLGFGNVLAGLVVGKHAHQLQDYALAVDATLGDFSTTYLFSKPLKR